MAAESRAAPSSSCSTSFDAPVKVAGEAEAGASTAIKLRMTVRWPALDHASGAKRRRLAYAARLTALAVVVCALAPAISYTSQPASAITSASPQQIVFASKRTGNGDLYLIRADGKRLRRITADALEESSPVWSPDGSRIAFDGRQPHITQRRPLTVDVSVLNPDGSARRRVALSLGIGEPSWSPDGKRLAYSTLDDDSGRSASIHLVNSDGTADMQLTHTASGQDRAPAWSPDGRWIAFFSNRAGGAGQRIYFVRPDGTGQRLLPHPGGWSDISPSWSPDGRRLVFESALGNREGFLSTSNVSGRSRVDLTRRFGWRGHDPSWSRDGRSVAFSCKRGRFLHICVGDLRTGALKQLTRGSGSDRDPDWPKRDTGVRGAAGAGADAARRS